MPTNPYTGMFDQWTTDSLKEAGFDKKITKVLPKNIEHPYTMTGVPNAQAYIAPDLLARGSNGFVLSSPLIKNREQNRGLSPALFISPEAKTSTIAHETEHLLARQNLGFPQETRDKFNAILKKEAGDSAVEKRNDFLQGLIKSLPYLEQKYGLDNGYMDATFINKSGDVGLYEIFATLASAESSQNVDLTKDPELRKTMFKDPIVRQAYNAVVGLRQTRMDSKDIPPYTYIPEKDTTESWWSNPLRKLGF